VIGILQGESVSIKTTYLNFGTLFALYDVDGYNIGYMDIEQGKFDRSKAESEDAYRKIGEVYCPYLKEKVAFNAKGLEHVKLKERNKARSKIDQYMRLRLLAIAPKIVTSSHTLQEFYETKKLETQKINSRWEDRVRTVRYYGFVAIIKSARIKIIVKEIEGGNKFFWSIIPFWKNHQKNSGNNSINKKILHAGNMEED